MNHSNDVTRLLGITTPHHTAPITEPPRTSIINNSGTHWLHQPTWTKRLYDRRKWTVCGKAIHHDQVLDGAGAGADGRRRKSVWLNAIATSHRWNWTGARDVSLSMHSTVAERTNGRRCRAAVTAPSQILLQRLMSSADYRKTYMTKTRAKTGLCDSSFHLRGACLRVEERK